LDQIAFALADGAELFFVIGDVLLIGGDVFGGKEDGAAGESAFECVERGFGFTFGAGRASGKLRIRGVGDAFCFGDRVRFRRGGGSSSGERMNAHIVESRTTADKRPVRS
jgi:hypothetical protein